MPQLLAPNLQLISASTTTQQANWKIVAEAFLEGYHIRFTHRDTFFPVQFDNLNVIEHFGFCQRLTNSPISGIENPRSRACRTNLSV